MAQATRHVCLCVKYSQGVDYVHDPDIQSGQLLFKIWHSDIFRLQEQGLCADYMAGNISRVQCHTCRCTCPLLL